MSATAAAHASSPVDSLHRPAGKRLTGLDVGEPRTVRLFYFLPNDRPFRPDVVQKMKDAIQTIQNFYGDQMEAHGFGHKTFRFETDDEGEPLVHRVDGQHPDSNYLRGTFWATVTEVEQAYDLSSSVNLLVVDTSTAPATAGWWSKRQRRCIGPRGISLANSCP